MSREYGLFLEIALLVAAVSIDSLLASLALGIDKVKIPFKSAAAMHALCAGMLLVSMLLGKFLGGVIRVEWTRLLGFTVLFITGLLKLCDGAVKWLIRQRKEVYKKLNFHIFDLQFLLTIYADPNKADADRGGILSIREAVYLGITLSLDSAAAGIGAGVLKAPALFTAVIAFAVGLCTVYMGSAIGNRVSAHGKGDFSWVSGLLFLLLAFLKIKK